MMFDTRDFDRRFKQSQRRHDIMFRVISTIVALTFVGIVCFWIFAGVLAVNAVDQVGEQGVRGVVEQLWCGKTADCKLPL
jgi:hypothetical protein